MIGLTSIANGGRQIHISHRGSFLRNCTLFCYFIGLLTVNIYFNWGRRKVDIVSHLLPVSVWSIVSREIILLPAALIPLPEEANRSRPSVHKNVRPSATLKTLFLIFILFYLLFSRVY